MIVPLWTARSSRLVGLLWLLAAGGCATPLGGWRSPQAVANPFLVQAVNHEILWERTIDVLHRYHFSVAREDRVAGVIETAPRVGSSLFEPWHRDSVGFENRLESTLQSIRRRVLVTLLPADTAGNYFVSVQAVKEREDVTGASVKSAGGSTFLESQPLAVDLDPILGLTAPPGYVALGRDAALEQSLLRSLQAAYAR